MKRLLSLFSERRGNVLVIVIASLTALIAFTGIAMDLGRVIATKAQLQRNFDSTTLAGAAKLDLTPTGLTNATDTAFAWSSRNSYSGGTPTFAAWSDANSGNIQLGDWNFATNAWTRSTSPHSQTLNALRAQWSASVPTPFLSIIGMPSINISAQSTAAANCPAGPPPGAPVAPFVVPMCTFNTTASNGCGALIEVDTNGWVDQTGGANANNILNQLVNAANDGPPPVTLYAGMTLDSTTGSLQTVFDDLAKYNPGGNDWPSNLLGEGGSSRQLFKLKWDPTNAHYYPDSGRTYTVRDNSNNVTYTGRGWAVYGGVAPIPCSGSPSTATITTFVKLVIVQIISNNGRCAVTTPSSPSSTYPWFSLCDSTSNGFNGGISGSGTGSVSNRLYAYIDCSAINNNSAPTANCPLIALGRPRLVK